MKKPSDNIRGETDREPHWTDKRGKKVPADPKSCRDLVMRVLQGRDEANHQGGKEI